MSNKEKLIAAAQKNLLKGQIAKAIKDYQKVVELDPRDIRSRQKLADLFVRAKMPKEAQEQYEGVARYYTENGFFLKAIAVYKQIQRIDPSRVEIYHRLAELNARQGLVGNALAEYKCLVSLYEKQGLVPEAINILKKMKDIDPENLNIRVKIAESYARAGMREQGLGEFRDVLKVLRAKGDPAKTLKLFQIFQPLFPGEAEVRHGFARALIDAGQLDAGIERVRKMLTEQPGAEDLQRTLALGLHRQGDFAGECQAWQELLRQAPADPQAREGYLRACLKSGRHEDAIERLELWQEELFAAQRVDLLRDLYEQLHAALPDDPRVIKNLQAVYQACGQGDKLLDLMSLEGDEFAASTPGQPEEAFETLDGSVLAEATLDLADEQDAVDLGGEEPVEELPLEFIEDAPEQPEQRDLQEVSASDVDAETELELEFEGDLLADLAPSAAEEEDLGEEPEFADTDLGELELIELPEVPPLQEETSEFSSADLSEISFDNLDADESWSVPEAAEQTTGDSEGRAEFEDTSGFLGDELPDLDIEFDRDSATAVPASPAAARTSSLLSEVERERLEGDLSRFRKNLESQIDEGDAETHFNLGIAFKEMGLLDDAVAEFDQSMRNLSRRLDSLTLKGICLKDKGDFEGAEEALKSALLLPDIREADLCNLYFELGLLHEQRDLLEPALHYFDQVSRHDPSFREVGKRIGQLRGRLGMKGGDSDRVSYL
ncbi:tetratricopeptide repeat protein [Geoalkalibacter halelectricus]|uniref:Tetratricopeptide repeat protein n=1 Tax=Geoalkalibacter halelectricus TaxID=2847045 RepID=A0ABY5ZHT5_9BACT|nr:tetratricopeptide repeat protein [Geoalkalibacter halelectricus]MDO3376580.1 tetratricopeptide repeat protein [Geoalkalibacter halelectricus]UWZ78459.1 tetratricopeptide repeat protein [Geoalkalibacter halelectricus]